MAKNGDMTGWVGWVGFASFMLTLAGFFSLLAGFVALFKHSAVYVQNTLYVFNYTGWGWIHILLGVLAISAAGSLMKGNMYGRVVAVLVALLSAVANMAFVPIYPVWSIMVVVVDILVIFAVTAHGKEVKELQ